MLGWTGSDGPVRFAITDREGGTSRAPYGGLNLGDHVGDASPAVRANRALLAEAIGLPPHRLAFMRQVHGREVAVIEQDPRPDVAPVVPEVDAMVTRLPGLALVVLVADCTPVLLADPDAGVIGVAHAGRPGLAAGVVPALVQAMGDLGARRLVARVGPSVCGRCYEVPLAMREEVAAVAPEARTVTSRGTPALDVAAGVVAQLAPACAELEWLPGCTREREDLYSYRRDGTTGRFAGLVWLER